VASGKNRVANMSHRKKGSIANFNHSITKINDFKKELTVIRGHVKVVTELGYQTCSLTETGLKVAYTRSTD